SGRRSRADHSGYCGELRRDFLSIASALDEDVQRLHHAGADPGRGELVTTCDRRAGAGEVLQLRFVRVYLRADPGQYGDDREADGGDRDRAPEHDTSPPAPD